MLSPISIGRISSTLSQRLSHTAFLFLNNCGYFDTSTLEAQCHNFLVQGLACSRCCSHTCSQIKFYDSCNQLGRVNPLGSPYPADEWNLCLFATFLANTVQYSTIKVYLSALSKPLLNYLRLQRVLQGRRYGGHL